MRFDNRLLDEIKARLSLSDIVGRRVSWDRRKTQPGRGDFWACCPFHQEKSPVSTWMTGAGATSVSAAALRAITSAS
ncbi:CHC2 zinc finger domain-containing protein [Pannonibacter sp. Pt2-lr]